MNVNRLYVAQIFINCGPSNFQWHGKFVKTTVVYNTNNGFVDLITREKYKMSLCDSCDGELYVNSHYGFFPICEKINVNFDKCNLSKKKIIRTLSNSKLLNKKEDDK